MSQVLNALIARGGTARPAEAFYAGVDQSQINRRRNALTEMEGQRLAMDQQTQARNMEVSRLNQQNAEIDRRLGPLSLAARAGNQQAQAELLGALRLDPGLINDPEAPRLWDSLARKYGGMTKPVEAPSSVRTYEYFQSLTPDQQQAFLRANYAPSFRDLEGAEGTVPFNTRTGGVGGVIPGTEAGAIREREAADAAAVEGAKVTSRTAAESAAAAPSEIIGLNQQLDTIDRNMAVVDQALGIVDWTNTGVVGAALKNVAGTSAYDLREMLKPVLAELGFGRLQQMREASKTGGALGQVSERELALLVGAVRSLEQAQSKPAMISALRDVKRYYVGVRRYMKGIAAMKAGTPFVSSVAEARQLPPGTQFVDPRGYIRTVPNAE